MRTILFLLLAVAANLVAARGMTLVEAGDPAVKIAEIIRSDDDPRWGSDQSKGSRLPMLIYWLVVAQQRGLDLTDVIDQACLAADPTMSPSRTTRLGHRLEMSIHRNLDLARQLGLLAPGSVQILKAGGRPLVTRGRYPGSPVVIQGLPPEVVTQIGVKNKLETLSFVEGLPAASSSLPPAPVEFVKPTAPAAAAGPTGGSSGKQVVVYEHRFRERINLPSSEGRGWELEVREKSPAGIKAALVSVDRPIRREYAGTPSYGSTTGRPGSVKYFPLVREIFRPASEPVSLPELPGARCYLLYETAGTEFYFWDTVMTDPNRFKLVLR